MTIVTCINGEIIEWEADEFDFASSESAKERETRKIPDMTTDELINSDEFLF